MRVAVDRPAAEPARVEERLDALRDDQRCECGHRCDATPRAQAPVPDAARRGLVRRRARSRGRAADRARPRAGSGGAPRARGRRASISSSRARCRERPRRPRSSRRASSPQRVAEFAEWRGGRLDAVPPDELEQVFVGSLHDQRGARALPRRRVARRGARPRAAGVRARSWPSSGRRRSRSSTAASTASSSRTRSPAAARTSATSSRRRRASTCSTSETTARWIVRTVNYIPYDPLHPARDDDDGAPLVELKAWLNRD